MINPELLRHHRTLAGLSQRKLSKLAGLGPLGIKRLEDGADAGRLPLAVVARIAEALKVALQDLLTASAPKPADPLADPVPLNYSQAKLLRRLHRGENITRRLTTTDREFTLPALVKAAAVTTTTGGVVLMQAPAHSLEKPRITLSEPSERLDT